MATSYRSSLGKTVAAFGGLLYGLLVLAVSLSKALTEKAFYITPEGEQEEVLAEASRELWSLSEGSKEVSHHFITLENGLQLHYLCPPTKINDKDSKYKKLVIFLHGFPDSSHLFTTQLRSSSSSNHMRVSLDLPGCGGSDSLHNYGPNTALNTVAEAITILKSRYLEYDSSSKCILVGHDWGGIIASRLAAETEGLLTHVVVLNSLYPSYVEKVIRTRVARGKALLSSWRWLEAARVLGPVITQLGKSSYTYMLTLPIPLAKLIPKLTLSLVRFSHALQYKHAPPPSTSEVATRLIISYGPGRRECLSSNDNHPTYSASVLARSQTFPPGDWDGRTRLYAHGLLRGKWDPSYPGCGIVRQQKARPKFQCPVSIIFGLQDVALDSRLIVDGIEECFVDAEKGGESCITRLPSCGHWSMLENDGRRALDEVLGNLLGSEQ